MDARSKTQSIEYLKAVLDTSFGQEETQEAIVPDSYPDVAQIVSVEGNVILRSKEADAGRVSASGAVLVSVVYEPEGEAGLRSLGLTIPFNAGLDVAEVTDNSKLSVVANLASIDARMINSRKVLVKADVLVGLQAYEPAAMQCVVDLEEVEDQGLHLQREEMELCFVSALREKTFVVADDFALPAGRPAVGQVLKSRVRLLTDDVKSVGSKLIFKGYAGVEVLYTAAGSDEVHQVEFTASFSQMLELEEEAPEANHEIDLMLNNLYVEEARGEDGGIAIELHMLAQAVEKRISVVPYLSDAYSTKFDLNIKQIEQQVESLDPTEELTAEIRESIELGQGVLRVLDSGICIGKTHVSQEGGKLTISVPVTLSVLYSTEDGRVAGLTRRFEAGTQIDMRANRTYGARAHGGSEIQILPGANGLEVRIPIQFQVWPCKRFRFSAIDHVNWDEENPKDTGALPSVVVYHAQGGETLWYMAKRYSSTGQQILQANSLEEDMVPYPGQLFIIPKAR